MAQIALRGGILFALRAWEQQPDAAFSGKIAIAVY